MKTNVIHISCIALSAAIFSASANAAPQITIDRNLVPLQPAAPLYYQFGTIPSNSSTDLANGITPTIVGALAAVSGMSMVLTDGPGGAHGNDLAASLIFDDPSPAPHLIILDLGSVKQISQVNTYSWHYLAGHPGSGDRSPQDYDLYVSSGTTLGFSLTSVASPGWTLLASVDTEILGGPAANAGQHGVSISDTTGSLGSYRYVALSVEAPFGFGHTFYSEIDVVAVPEPSILSLAALAGMGLIALRRQRPVMNKA